MTDKNIRKSGKNSFAYGFFSDFCRTLKNNVSVVKSHCWENEFTCICRYDKITE